MLNLIALRRIFNANGRGRGAPKVHTRIDIHTTIRATTFVALEKFVPLQKGGYAAPIIELGILILLYLSNGNSGNLDEILTQVFLSSRLEVADRLIALGERIKKFGIAQEIAQEIAPEPVIADEPTSG